MSNPLFRSSWQNFKAGMRPANNIRQHKFEDRLLKAKNTEFKHSWTNIAHMYALRMWTVAYAPSEHDNLRRMQEMHRLNGEMWYLISDSMWKRTLLLVAMFVITNRLMRHHFMNNGEKDSHDMSWRDMHSHM